MCCKEGPSQNVGGMEKTVAVNRGPSWTGAGQAAGSREAKQRPGERMWPGQGLTLAELEEEIKRLSILASREREAQSGVHVGGAVWYNYAQARGR